MAPDIGVPDVGVDLEHLVAGHVEGLVDAVGGFEEGGGGVGGVARETGDEGDEAGEKGEGEEGGDETCDKGDEEGEVGIFEEGLWFG